MNDARGIYVARTYAYVAAGSQGIVIVDVERPESPKIDQTFNADGALNDARDVKIAMTNASVFGYVADGKNGLRVLEMVSANSTPGAFGFSPRPSPRLIATYHTHEPALAVSKGLDRDRAVDESGNQVAVFGRRGGRPLNLEEMQRMYLRHDGKGGKVALDRAGRRPGGAPRNDGSGARAVDAGRTRSGAAHEHGVRFVWPTARSSWIRGSTLPDVLDLLIVGGGPMGTACAFRAKELGLAALVIEMDDLMKRIRDYAKDKPILPGLRRRRHDAVSRCRGAGRRAAIRADRQGSDGRGVERAVPRSTAFPAKVGVELLELTRPADGVWHAAARNHYTKQSENYRARHVVLALGRGVPRRLDIPGNVHDLALRLTDAQQYVGGPVCVIGGGTSAAEAAIAISNAKAQSESDESPVYWSYRGRFMPKVSQALAPELFDVMMINGNLRFILGSDPIGGDDPRWARSLSRSGPPSPSCPGQPREVVQLEFPKAFCVACIGADRPDPLLRSLGVEFVPKESGDGDRLVVSPLLESRRAGLYVGGDLLSPDYAETTNFDGHPSTFNVQAQARQHQGCTARRRVARGSREAAAGRVARTSASCLPPRPPVAVTAPAAGRPGGASRPTAPRRRHRSAGQSRPVDFVARGRDARRRVPADRADGVTTIGRQGTTVQFEQDTMLSDQHAAISHGPGGLELRDLCESERRVPEGCRRARARRSNRARWSRPAISGCSRRRRPPGLRSFTTIPPGTEVARHAIAGEHDRSVLGRAAPATGPRRTDSTLSRRHLSLSTERGRLLLRDLGSRNGTFVKVEGAWPLHDGDLLWLGNQVLAAEHGCRSADARHHSSRARLRSPVRPAAEPAARSRPPRRPRPGEPSVTFAPGKTYPFGKSPTLLDLALAKRVRIKYECKVGDCGKCRVDVIAGAEHLDPRTPQEDKALRMIGHDEPECRLACLVLRVGGPVSVQVPK